MAVMRFDALRELYKRKPKKVELPSGQLSDYYAVNVFTKEKMRDYLSRDVYKAFVRKYPKVETVLQKKR